MHSRIITPDQWAKLSGRQRKHAIDAGLIPGIAGGAVAAPAAQRQAVAALPFTAGAHEHVEGPAVTLTVTPTTSVQQLAPIDVPAYGYFRSLYIEISGAGGTGGTIAADGPWNLIQSVSLQDVNGSAIVNPIDGYSLYIANLFGGYAFNQNPSNVPWFVGTSPNPVFGIRVPVEIVARDGLGALANQNSAATYKLQLAINTIAAAFSVAPSPVPTLTIKVWYEGWTLPAAMSMNNQPQAQVPPLLGTGQIWSSNPNSTLSGANLIPLRRTGNVIRLAAMIGRTAAGVRSDTVLPDPLTLAWDGNNIWQSSVRYMQAYAMEKLNGVTPAQWPAGVVVFPFNHGFIGRMGNDSPDLWFPTTQSTRLEVTGNAAAPGSVQVLTNEIAPVEENQPERYMVPNDTGRLIAPAQ